MDKDILDQEDVPLSIEEKTVNSTIYCVPGLVNFGNTCYFNALLQCFASLPTFVAYLEELESALKQEVQKNKNVVSIVVKQKTSTSKSKPNTAVGP